MRLSWSDRKKLAEQFIQDITNRPQDFFLGPFRLHDSKTSRDWWIGTSLFGFELYEPFQASLGFRRYRCWWHFRKWKKLYKTTRKEDLRVSVKDYMENLHG